MSDFSLIASIGVILPALILGLIIDIIIIIIDTKTAIPIAPHDITNFKSKLSTNGFTPLFKIEFTTANTIPILAIPTIIPNGIEIMPSTAPSKNILFLICFDVAPILASIPNSLVFSVSDILKLFLITNADVNNIITITIPAIIIIKSFVLTLLNLYPLSF